MDDRIVSQARAQVQAVNPAARRMGLFGKKVTDPVCGMKIDPKKAAATVGHGDHVHHFCSTSCKQKFEAGGHQH